MESEIDSEDIIRLRKAMKMTRKDLAARLGVDPTTVLRWEQGARPTGTAAIVLRAAIASIVKKREGMGLIASLTPAIGLHQLLSAAFKDTRR